MGSYVDLEDEEEMEKVWMEWGPDLDLDGLIDAYSDLQVFRDNSGYLLLCSASINGDVDGMELESDRHEPGAPVKIWPSIDTESGVRIYSVPPELVIARPNKRGFGVVPEPNLDETMTAMGLPRAIIKEVRLWLLGQSPVSYLDDGQ